MTVMSAGVPSLKPKRLRRGWGFGARRKTSGLHVNPLLGDSEEINVFRPQCGPGQKAAGGDALRGQPEGPEGEGEFSRKE